MATLAILRSRAKREFHAVPVGGLMLPYAREVTFNGKPAPDKSMPVDSIRVDFDVDAGLFSR